jgi:hypothetical protein
MGPLLILIGIRYTDRASHAMLNGGLNLKQREKKSYFPHGLSLPLFMNSVGLFVFSSLSLLASLLSSGALYVLTLSL